MAELGHRLGGCDLEQHQTYLRATRPPMRVTIS